MRKIILISFCSFFLHLSPALADVVPQDPGLQADGQFVLTFSRTFGLFAGNEDYDLGFFGQGTFFTSLTTGPLLFGYLGPDLSLLCSPSEDQTKVCDLNLKLVTGTFLSLNSEGSVEASLLASFWLIKNNLFFPNLNLFVEYDQLLPISHPEVQFYTIATLTYNPLPGEFGFGLVTEHFGGYQHSWVEAAAGLILNISVMQAFICYDATPNLPGQLIWFRFQVNL